MQNVPYGLFYKAYENDFKQIGAFEEEEESYDGQIFLSCNVWPGRFDPKSKSWQKEEGEAYQCYFVYRNKSFVEVFLNSDYDGGEKFIPSFQFARKIAKKYAMVNTNYSHHFNRQTHEEYKVPYKPSFEDIEKFIEYCQNKDGSKTRFRTAESWHKVMTLADAKQLVKDFKITVNFPS